MTPSLIDTSNFQIPFFSLSEGSSSDSKNIFTSSQPKPLTGRRLAKQVVRTSNMMVKTVFASTGDSSRGVQNVRQVLNLAKQGVTATKVVRNVIAISREKKEVPWQTRVYHWVNMMQSLIVCTITTAPLIDPSYNHGRAIVSLCSLVRSGAKLVYDPEMPNVSLEERQNIRQLKGAKQILSIAAEFFVFIGLVFGIVLLPKTAFLIVSLAAVNLGIAKTFYKRTRAPVDEFPLLA